jgi:hypothetical protein
MKAILPPMTGSRSSLLSALSNPNQKSRLRKVTTRNNSNKPRGKVVAKPPPVEEEEINNEWK